MLNDIKGIVKTETQNRKAIYKLLKMDKVPDGGKVLLAFLGHPRFVKMFKKDHPNSQVIVLDNSDLNWLFDESQKDIMLVDPVNINQIKEILKNMKFDYIIMNPPYNGNLHLKILEEAMQHSDKIVNLSPVRWLQDPLARYKKNSDLKKFNNICKKIKSLNIISKYDAYNLFDKVQFTMDLGLYIIDKNNKIEFSNFSSSIVDKIVSKLDNTIEKNIEKNTSKGIRVRLYPVKPENVHRASNINAYISTNYCICTLPNEYKVYKNGYNIDNGLHWGSDRKPGAGGNKISENTPLNYSLQFSSILEAKNFLKSTWTQFMMWYNNKIKIDNNLQFSFLPYMKEEINPRTGLKGYEGEWTSEDFYQFFNLTPAEIKIIEDDMKEYE